MHKKLTFLIAFLFFSITESFSQNYVYEKYYEHFDKAVNYVKVQSFKEAILELNTCKILMPNNISSYLYSAEIYQEMSLFKEALYELESAYKIDSLDYRVFYNKAICLTKLYKYKEAIDIYILIINNISKEPLFYVERANLYNKIRNKKQSCLDYRTALYNGSTTARDSIDKYCKGKF